MIDVNNFQPHAAQWRVLESKSKFILASSGVQGGNTFIGAVWFVKQLERMGRKGTFLIGAPTYKILFASTLPKFIEMIGSISKIGVYKKLDSEIILHGGLGKIYIRSLEDPDHIEGMTVDGAIWFDEAGQMKEKVWINALARRAIAQAPILLTTTPYMLNWVYKKVYKSWQRGDKDYEVVQWKSVDNPAFPKEEYDKRKASMGENDFARRYEGEWRQISGLVYPDFTYDTHCVDPIPLNPEWDYYCGIDWGFTNPTAIVWFAKDYDGNYYVFDEYLVSGKTSSEHAEYVLQQQSKLPKQVKAFYCDPAGRDEISTFVMAGLRNTYGTKSEVMEGIRRVTGLIKTRKLFVFKKCINLIEQMEIYRIQEGRESQDPREEPVKKEDHLTDALRYGIYNTTIAAAPTYKPNVPYLDWFYKQQIDEKFNRDMDAFKKIGNYGTKDKPKPSHR